MKCPNCNGRKKILEPCDGALLGTVLVTCDVCDGTGEVTMTNEEWFCGLSTKEKAKRIINIAVNSDCDYRTIVEWLKQPHTFKE